LQSTFKFKCSAGQSAISEEVIDLSSSKKIMNQENHAGLD